MMSVGYSAILKNSEILAYDSATSEFSSNEFTTADELSEYHFYTLLLYYNSDFEKYSRSYMKLQELSALVGGFMKLVMFFADIICFTTNTFLFFMKAINQNFEKKDSLSKSSFNDKTMDKMVNQHNDFKKKIIDDKSKITANNFIQPKNIAEIPKRSLSINSSVFKEISKESMIDIGYPKYLINKYLCFNKSIEYRMFNSAEIIISKRTDVGTYLKLLNQFEFIKENQFNQNQNLALNMLKKLNIEDYQTIDKYNKINHLS